MDDFIEQFMKRVEEEIEKARLLLAKMREEADLVEAERRRLEEVRRGRRRRDEAHERQDVWDRALGRGRFDRRKKIGFAVVDVIKLNLSKS